jgi:hypothetical protein
MKSPITKIEENEIHNSSKISFFYRVLPDDLEHLYENEIRLAYSSLINSLNGLPNRENGYKEKSFSTNEQNYFYKFYTINSETYLCSDDQDPKIHGWKLEPCDKPLSSIFQYDDFYSDVQFEKDHIVTNGRYLRFINLYSLPPSVDFNDLHQAGDMFVCFRKYPLEQSKSVANVARRIHTANINGVHLRNIESEKSVDEAENIYNSLIEGSMNLYDLQAWFVINETTKEALEHRTVELISYLKRLDSTPLIETVANPTLLEIYIPGSINNFKRSHLATTDYLACFIPYANNSIHKEGVEFYSVGFNPVQINLFNSEALNYNALITGKSGSGKSMSAQKLVLENILNGCSAVILDKGHSFRKLANYLNGNIFSEKFNPMQFDDPAYLKAFILSAIPESEFTVRQRGKLYEVIQKFLASDKPQTFSSLIDRLEEDFKDISCYFAEFWPFISDEEIAIKNLTYVDTTIYPKNVVGAVIIYLIQYFKSINGNKIFVFDECWEYLNNNSEYIEECFRTFRKHNASAIAITQDIGDFLATQKSVGRIVFNNTTHKFFFQQNNIPTGQINEEDAAIITSIRTIQGEYSEFLYKDDSIKKVARYVPSNLEHELFTSRMEHNIAFNKFHSKMKDYFDFKTTIERWIDFKYKLRIDSELL